MNRPIFLAALSLAGAALAPAPAAATSDNDGRAVAACRAEMLARFDAGQIHFYRLGDISGGARSTRVTFHVDADRRYEFRCAADAHGQVVTAAFDPPRANERQLAAGTR